MLPTRSGLLRRRVAWLRIRVNVPVQKGLVLVWVGGWVGGWGWGRGTWYQLQGSDRSVRLPIPVPVGFLSEQQLEGPSFILLKGPGAQIERTESRRRRGLVFLAGAARCALAAERGGPRPPASDSGHCQ